MLYWLLYQKGFVVFHIGPFRIFRYLTFRTAFASLTALFIGLIIGPAVIRRIREFQIGQYIRDAMSHSWMSRLGYFFARDAFMALRDKMDPGRVNGGVFLGLDGVVIKSHGGADAESYAGAIEVGYDMVRQELLGKIREMIAQANEARAPVAAPAAS